MNSLIQPEQLPASETGNRGNDISGQWESVYCRVYPAMLAYAARRLGSDNDPRDAVSEAMLRAVSNLERWQASGATMEAWLFGILRHVVLDLQRKHYRNASQWTPLLDQPADQEDRLVAQEERAEVRAAFLRLPERDREILELKVIAQLSSEEAAKVLGMRHGAFRMAQARALARLRVDLGKSGRQDT